VDQVHHTCVEQQMGIGTGGGAYATWDDGNPAWQTEDEDEDDPAQEAIWQADDQENGEILPSSGNDNEDLKEKSREKAEGLAKVRILIGYYNYYYALTKIRTSKRFSSGFGSEIGFQHTTL
jgi:hypothetical protein